ncbi:MAG: PAS domain S-box protein, partial [Anaerolineales bacterium]
KLFILTPAVAAETILNTMVDALFLVSLASEIVSTNKAACQLLKYQENDLIGQPIEFIFTPNEKIKIKEIELEQLMKTGFITDVETHFETKQGEIINATCMSFRSQTMCNTININYGGYLTKSV